MKIKCPPPQRHNILFSLGPTLMVMLQLFSPHTCISEKQSSSWFGAVPTFTGAEHQLAQAEEEGGKG